MEYSNEQIEKLLNDIYAGRVTSKKLPKDLYLTIVSYFEKGLYKGFGGTLSSFSGNRLELLKELRENVWLFSGAKTYQSVRAMEAMLTENGELRTLKEFKEFALQEYELYNKTWAKTEYDTAIAQAQNAESWAQIEEDKDTLPLLRYSAIMDANTSEICAPLDGITLPVDDPFWDVYMPINHYNCRCLVEQLADGDITPKDKLKEVNSVVGSEMNDVFRMNVGKSGEVFAKDHPYFTEIPKKDIDFAKENFGLPLPKNED